jgi:hypothetical protein
VSWPELLRARQITDERHHGFPRPPDAMPALPIERRFAAERPAARLGESMDRWPTLPDPVPDDEPRPARPSELERWARLDREQRSA